MKNSDQNNITVCFKKVLYGDEKDTILAVVLKEGDTELLTTFQLGGVDFSVWGVITKQRLRLDTKNAKEKEYLSTLTKLKNLGYTVTTVKSVKTK